MILFYMICVTAAIDSNISLTASLSQSEIVVGQNIWVRVELKNNSTIPVSISRFKFDSPLVVVEARSCSEQIWRKIRRSRASDDDRLPGKIVLQPSEAISGQVPLSGFAISSLDKAGCYRLRVRIAFEKLAELLEPSAEMPLEVNALNALSEKPYQELFEYYQKGNRADEEAVLHDFLKRHVDSPYVISAKMILVEKEISRSRNSPMDLSADESKKLVDLLNEIKSADPASASWVFSQKANVAMDFSSLPNWPTLNDIMQEWEKIDPQDQRFRMFKERLSSKDRSPETQPR